MEDCVLGCTHPVYSIFRSSDSNLSLSSSFSSSASWCWIIRIGSQTFWSMLLYCDAFCAFELLYFEYPIGLRHLTLVQVPQVGISSQGIEVHQSLPVQPLGVSCVTVCGGGFGCRFYSSRQKIYTFCRFWQPRFSDAWLHGMILWTFSAESGHTEANLGIPDLPSL